MVETETPAFGALLAELRVAAGLTQAELAQRAGIAPDYAGMIERGLRRPAPPLLSRIAAALDVSTEDWRRLKAARDSAPARYLTRPARPVRTPVPEPAPREPSVVVSRARALVTIDARDEPQLAEAARRLRDGTPGERQRLRDALAAALVAEAVVG